MIALQDVIMEYLIDHLTCPMGGCYTALERGVMTNVARLHPERVRTPLPSESGCFHRLVRKY